MIAAILNFALALGLLGTPMVAMVSDVSAPAAVSMVGAVGVAAPLTAPAGPADAVNGLVTTALTIVRNVFGGIAALAMICYFASILLQGVLGDIVGNSKGMFMKIILVCIGAGLATQIVNMALGVGGEIQQVAAPGKSSVELAMLLLLELRRRFAPTPEALLIVATTEHLAVEEPAVRA